MSMITELVRMKTAEGITKEDFIAIVDGLEKNYHSKQPGFMDTELIYDEGNKVWIMIQHWQTREQLKAASKKMFQDSEAEAFVKAIDPKSVEMTICPLIKRWE